MAITAVGESQDFAYTGGVQEFTASFTGLYKLEVWGAKGGSYLKEGGLGGYGVGYVLLKKGTVLHVVCGGAGSGWADGRAGTVAGGYNGGGAGYSRDGYSGGCSGGGATHIAYVTGTLKSIGYDSFATNGNGLIVAGGGGGASRAFQQQHNADGQAGGGTAGGGAGTFGYGGSGSQDSGSAGAGGGGGFYGGKGTTNGYYEANGGGGGSGWIDGVPEITYKGTTYSPSMSNGANNGNGKATITFVAKGFPTIPLNGINISEMTFNGVEVSAWIHNGVELQ